MGAFHAANFALKRADLFPLAMCFSGNYDPSTWHGWGERAGEAYFSSPMDYTARLEGDHFEWLRSQVSLLLVCGQDLLASVSQRRPPSGILLACGLVACECGYGLFIQLSGDLHGP
jgi:esterase/lipase superfamily enzyme